MILSDKDIHSALTYGRLIIDPWNTGLIQPCSYDVTLGDTFLILPKKGAIVDPLNPPEPDEYEVRVGPYWLPAYGFALAHTAETVTLDGTLAARLEGKSSLGRLGLAVHSTAGFIDPGFTGQITLELSNLTGNSLKLTPGMQIAQLAFEPTTSPPMRDYAQTGRYSGQQGATPSKGTRL